MERFDLRDGYVPSHRQVFPKPGYPNPFMRRMMFPRDGHLLNIHQNASQYHHSHQNMMNSRIPTVQFATRTRNSESGFNNQVKFLKGFNHNPHGQQQRQMSTPMKSSSNNVHSQITEESRPTEPDTSSKTVTFSESILHSGSSEGASTGYTADCSSNISGKDGTARNKCSKTADTLPDGKNKQLSNADSKVKSILSLTKFPHHRTSKFCQVTKYICATLFLGLLGVMTFGIYASATGFLDGAKSEEGNRTLEVF